MQADQATGGGAALHGRVALVTGGATGLGRTIALRLAAEGMAVGVNYSHSGAEAHDAVAEIEAREGRAVAVRADVSDRRAVGAMFREVESVLGPVTVLVNNAGITQYVPFADVEDVTVELWDRVLGVNVVGAFLCVQAAVPAMLERGFGRIVNISSNSAFIAAGSCIPYVVSKSALVSLTQCLARALAPAILVNAVAPGWMLTPWLDKYLPAGVADKLRVGEAPLADVDDVARLVVDVAANGSITGQVLVADSGEMWQIPGVHPLPSADG